METCATDFRPMEIEILDGWYVEDLQSSEDCARAQSILLEQALSIEMQLKEANLRRIETGQYADGNWYRRAQAALKIKKRALQRVQDLRASFRKKEKQAEALSQDRILLNFIRDAFPLVFRQAVEEMQRRTETFQTPHGE